MRLEHVRAPHHGLCLLTNFPSDLEGISLLKLRQEELDR
jgi:hypothetical protein